MVFIYATHIGSKSILFEGMGRGVVVDHDFKESSALEGALWICDTVVVIVVGAKDAFTLWFPKISKPVFPNFTKKKTIAIIMTKNIRYSAIGGASLFLDDAPFELAEYISSVWSTKSLPSICPDSKKLPHLFLHANKN